MSGKVQPVIDGSATARDANEGDAAGSADRRAVEGVRAIVFLYREFERACRDLGISIPQYRLLLFMRHGARRAGELAATAAIKRPTLTSLVDGLEKDGRLKRVQVEADRRGVRLEVTEAGIEAIREVEARLAPILESLAGKGVAGGSESILDACRSLVQILEAEADQRLG